jgi:FMN phosphatase YigB (HAD superfamily)
MFRPSTLAVSTWALSAAHFGFIHPVTIAAFVLPWFIYQAYAAMITADDRTLNEVSPQNTIFLFDLHGVLFKSNMPAMIKMLAYSPCAGPIFLHCINPFFLYDVFQLYSHVYIGEYYILYLCNKYESLQPCMPVLLKIANQQIPAWKTIDIVRQLKARGYTIHLFSNIGEHLFADLQEQYPDIFSLFDALVIGSKENNYRGKPHPSVFYNYIINHPASDKQRLLIDDRARNIAFARAFNIAGIRYRSAGSLLKVLQAHKIL